MSDIKDIADRFEIQTLQADCIDALMMHDYDRVAGLFTEDGVVRVPHINAEGVGREQMRAGAEKAQDMWNYFIQITHPGSITLDGDTANGRAFLIEFGQFKDGNSHRNFGIYHDSYRRTADGWKFAERVYELKYVDTTPLGGTARVVEASATEQTNCYEKSVAKSKLGSA